MSLRENSSFPRKVLLAQNASIDRSHIAHGIPFQRIEPVRKRPRKLNKTTESLPDRLTALRRERQIKGWTKAKKLALANDNLTDLKKLAKRKKP